jgi:hypothetical protein
MAEYRQDNAERIAEQEKRYRQAHAEWYAEYYKQYRQSHAEWYAEYYKQYRQANAERIAELIRCPCGSEVRRDGIRRHEQSQKHKDAIKSIADTNLAKMPSP